MIEIRVQIVVSALKSLDRDLPAVIELDVKINGILVIHMLKGRLDVGLVIDRSLHSRVDHLAAIGSVDQLFRHARNGKRNEHYYNVTKNPHLLVFHIEYPLAEEEEQHSASRKKNGARDQSLQDRAAVVGF